MEDNILKEGVKLSVGARAGQCSAAQCSAVQGGSRVLLLTAVMDDLGQQEEQRAPVGQVGVAPLFYDY